MFFFLAQGHATRAKWFSGTGLYYSVARILITVSIYINDPAYHFVNYDSPSHYSKSFKTEDYLLPRAIILANLCPSQIRPGYLIKVTIHTLLYELQNIHLSRQFKFIVTCYNKCKAERNPR